MGGALGEHLLLDTFPRNRDVGDWSPRASWGRMGLLQLTFPRGPGKAGPLGYSNLLLNSTGLNTSIRSENSF